MKKLILCSIIFLNIPIEINAKIHYWGIKAKNNDNKNYSSSVVSLFEKHLKIKSKFIDSSSATIIKLNNEISFPFLNRFSKNLIGFIEKKLNGYQLSFYCFEPRKYEVLVFCESFVVADEIYVDKSKIKADAQYLTTLIKSTQLSNLSADIWFELLERLEYEKTSIYELEKYPSTDNYRFKKRTFKGKSFEFGWNLLNSYKMHLNGLVNDSFLKAESKSHIGVCRQTNLDYCLESLFRDSKVNYFL